jgi:hypothetical protein
MSDAHRAVELEDLVALHNLLDGGADIHEEYNGLTLLHHAIDVEIDGHVQSGEPLHVDTTAYLLARGADPTRKSMGGKGISATQMAENRSHWLASYLIQQWINRHAD